MRIEEIAARLGATSEGPADWVPTGAATLEEAGEREIAFAKTAAQALAARAGAVIAPLDCLPLPGRTVIRVAQPRAAFAQVLTWLYPPPAATPGIHPTALISASAKLGAGVSVGAQSIVEEGAVIGPGCVIGPACRIGAACLIGAQSLLHGRVTLYHGVRVGARAVLHAGVVLGADGFGFVFTAGHYEKFPQVGTVELGDDVEIGANSCVDRAALGVTRIGDGSKLDNLVHIAHNCQIGKHVVIAAQTGFAGGVTVGDYAVIGGQVGVGERARIESRAVIGSGAGILSAKIVRAGEPVWGTPARPLRQYLTQLASLARVPGLREQLRQK
ncbi:MAG: UDP-3-O-(3-hydroxymyristoyl)glucosamine N-acyltransferase [Bryobacteraceae bacterium]|nr:UDP-3-O-(3-hydroxymyristoyl)glucosamine N-acyltransferase [Bryobacteraceae bacterium]